MPYYFSRFAFYEKKALVERFLTCIEIVSRELSSSLSILQACVAPKAFRTPIAPLE